MTVGGRLVCIYIYIYPGSPTGHHFLVRLETPSFTIFYYVRFIILQKEPPFLKWWLTSRVYILSNMFVKKNGNNKTLDDITPPGPRMHSWVNEGLGRNCPAKEVIILVVTLIDRQAFQQSNGNKTLTIPWNPTLLKFNIFAPEKWMVGRWVSFLGPGLFSGGKKLLVSGCMMGNQNFIAYCNPYIAG